MTVDGRDDWFADESFEPEGRDDQDGREEEQLNEEENSVVGRALRDKLKDHIRLLDEQREGL